MSVGETVSQAKKWCEEARKLLKLGSIFNKDGRAMSSRASDIAKELKKLEKEVNSNKIQLTPKQVTDYVNQFTTMAKALNEAALANDEQAVTLQSNRLEELKRELATHLAKGSKKETTSRTEFENTLKANFPGEKSVAIGHLNELKTHLGNAAIAVEIADIQLTKIDAAQTKHDTNKHEEARDLLLEVPAACVAPKQIAEKYVAYLNKLRTLEQKLSTFSNPDDVVKDELASIRRDKIDEAKKKAAHAVRDYPGAELLLKAGTEDLVKAGQTVTEYNAYLLSKTAAEGAMNLLKAHTDKDLVAKETTTAQTDLLDKAATEAVGKKWVDAKKLYDQATTTCNNLKALAQKIGTGNFKNYKTWALDMFAPIKTHAQKTVFATEIGRIEKRLEVVRSAFLKGMDNMGATEISKIYWECDGLKKQMDLHQTYVTKKTDDYTPKKNLLPAKTDGDFGGQITEIETQLASAEKAAGRRVYDSANRHLDAAIAGCVTVKKLVEDRTAYQSDLGPVELAVGGLPGDGDPVIGNEAKSVRTLLAGAKSLATAKDFKAAKARLPDVQTACDAAKLLAAKQSDAKNERDTAVNQPVPATALAEVRKLYEKLKLHAQNAAIVKQLEEIDKKLIAANTALTT